MKFFDISIYRNLVISLSRNIKIIINEKTCFAALIFNGFGGDDACLVKCDVKGEAHSFRVHTNPAVAQADVFGVVASAIRVGVADMLVEIALVGIDQSDSTLHAATRRKKSLISVV